MLKQFLNILRPYWFLIILSPLFILGEVWAYTKLPQLLSLIIDQGVIPLDMAVIKNYGLQMIFFTIVEALMSLGGLWCAAKVTIGVTTDLRQKVFRHIQNFSFADLDFFGTGSLITRLTNDIAMVQNTIMMLLRLALRAPIMMVACVFILLQINTQLSLILLVGTIILLIAIVILLKIALPLFIKSQKQLDDLNSVTEENLSAIKTIKTFVREKFVTARFAVSNRDLTETLLKIAKTMTIVFPIVMTVLNLSVVAVIWFGSRSIQAGQMEVGNLVAFINYATQILFSFVMTSFVFVMVMRSSASIKRLKAVLVRKSKLADPKKPLAQEISRGEIKFENVDFSFNRPTEKEDEQVLSNINFTLPAGQKMGIIGGTGSGKSTLVNLILRLYDVTDGRVLIDNIDVRDYPIAALRRDIGVVLQDTTLFSGTIQENLRWGDAEASIAELTQFTDIAQATDFINRTQEKFDHELARQATNLSGGQKQRLSIARALLKKAKILILDDATSAVDVKTEAKIWQEIRATQKEMTTIVVGQRISSVADSDLILVLDEGKIVGRGTHEQLLKENKIYQEIYAAQQ